MSQPEERQQVIRTFAKVAKITSRPFGILVCLFVAGIIALVIHDGLQSMRRAGIPLLPVAVETLGAEGIAVRKAIGQDQAGRKVEFEFVLLPRSIQFAKESGQTLIIDNKKFNGIGAKPKLPLGAIKPLISNARQILVLASASKEFDQATGAQIAGKRAAITARLIEDVAPPEAPIFEVNLGRYHTPCARCDTSMTTWRDAIIIVTVREFEWRAAIGEALRNAMAKPRNLPRLDRFSAFGMVRHHRKTTAAP